MDNPVYIKEGKYHLLCFPLSGNTRNKIYSRSWECVYWIHKNMRDESSRIIKIYLRELAITMWENKWRGMKVPENKCGLLDFSQTVGNPHVKEKNKNKNKTGSAFFEGNARNMSVI